MLADELLPLDLPAARAMLCPADLEALIAAVKRAAGLLDPVALATKAAHEARDVADADVTGVALVEGRRSVAMAGLSGEAGPWFSGLDVTVDLGRGFAGTILAAHQPLVLAIDGEAAAISLFDAEDGAELGPVVDRPYTAHLRDRVADDRLCELIGAPIVFAGEAMGILYAGVRTPRGDRRRRRLLVARFAAMIAPALAAACRARDAVVGEIAGERERIASELHDSVGQILFGIGVAAARARAAAAAGLPVTAELSHIEAEASRASAHLRAALEVLGRARADAEFDTEVRILAGMFARRAAVSAEVMILGVSRPLSADVRDALLGAVREGLHNVEKHAGAVVVFVTVAYEDRGVAIAIQDDGCGTRAPLDDARCFGLASLRRRLQRVGGTLTVAPLDGGGTILRACA